jgi:hypothetical protein
VCTVRPFQAILRGSPTLTDSSRAIFILHSRKSAFVNARSQPFACRKHFVDGQFAVGAVWNHRLHRFEMEPVRSTGTSEVPANWNAQRWRTR